MYKVFIDNYFVVFKKDEKFSTNVGEYFLPKLEATALENFKLFIQENSDQNPIYFAGPEPFKLMRSYFSDFTWIEASGGIVKNAALNKYLFIHRNNMWDLPKGKIEKSESAEDGGIREVQEECGIIDIRIERELLSTFHIYNAYGKHWLKKTHWFEMSSSNLELKPQTEEGITKAEWLDVESIEKIKALTYPSLVEVINAGVQSNSPK